MLKDLVSPEIADRYWKELAFIPAVIIYGDSLSELVRQQQRLAAKVAKLEKKLKEVIKEE